MITEKQLIVKMIFGSHLYGTNTENSDKDYKGVFMPNKRDILLGRIPKSITSNTKTDNSKNTPEDVDTETYSLHYFIDLACKGETVALDMLHAPEQFLLVNSDVWMEIIKNRHMFYTKNLKAFIGYARRQASKYGIKGSRLSDAKRVCDFLMGSYPLNGNCRLSDVWGLLPEGENIHKHQTNLLPNQLRIYEVCGRKLQETVDLLYAYDIIKKFYDNYGERARQAADNKNIDWKAVSHALRAGIQVKQLLTEGTITFPLKEADMLLRVKNGAIPYTLVSSMLDGLMDEVEELSRNSLLPDKVDRDFWDDFIVYVCG